MADRSRRTQLDQLHSTDGVRTIHADSFDVRMVRRTITIDVRSAASDGSSDDGGTAVLIELDRDSAGDLLGALQQVVNRYEASVVSESSADEKPDESQEPESTRSFSDGIPYQELGWTREQFDEAVASMAHLESYWDHDELDVYNEYLSR